MEDISSRAIRDIDALRSKAAALPRSPGVYIMHGQDGGIIYVGKSRSLRDRVSQYFHGTHDIKTERMAAAVYSFEFITCSSEIEALSLENRLIKHHTPKYNIKLKDAKSYPYIRLDAKTEYPRITMTRNRLDDGAMYFGPYSSTSTVYSVISSLERSLGIPSCKRKFPADIGRSRPCVNYQIGRCCGICTGGVTPEEYRKRINTAIDILRGGTAAPIRSLTEEMEKYSEELRFEEAARCRDMISALERLGERQTAVTSPGTECDVFGFCPASENSVGHDSISVFYIRSGYISDRDHYLPEDTAITDCSDESPLSAFITQLYDHREYIPKEILVSFDMTDSDRELVSEYLSNKAGRRITVKTPRRGASRSLCALAVKDACFQTENKISKSHAAERMLANLANILNLEVFPERIEAFDISNLGTEHITAGMVVMLNGQPAKSEYRTYSIASKGFPDDYGAMREAVLRRMAHTRDGGENPTPSPDLILLDGGIGHVNVITEALRDAGYYVPVFGMVKDEHHKTRTLVSDEGEIDISRKTDVFRFVYSLQEEVHRYTVGRMTKAKRKTLRRSSLEDIPGIGPAKAKRLMAHFGTLSAIEAADEASLRDVPGISKQNAENITSHFKNKEKS